MTATHITEQCGACWVARPAGTGSRAFWVTLVSGSSAAKPNVVGFYAPSINAALEALAN